MGQYHGEEDDDHRVLVVQIPACVGVLAGVLPETVERSWSGRRSAAGCSAAVFTARYGLDTLVLDCGNSSIQQCVFIENYLGFPGGIDVETFYVMSQAHAERVGATVVNDMATDLSETDDGFHVETQEGLGHQE